MRRRWWQILLGVIVVGALILGLNAIAVDNETKPARVTVAGGRILNLPAGDVQVTDTGPTASGPEGQPIVLVHCYTCSLHWWDRMVPILARHHRVVRVDLLGHGGSEKPSSGYAMEDQAALVGQAMNELHVTRAEVVGHSLGGTVGTALAEQSRGLVGKLVLIDQAPDNSYGSLPFLAKVAYVPILGQLLNRITPDALIKEGYKDVFAPGYDISSGFANPNQVVDDFNAMTYTSYVRSDKDEESYTDSVPLDQRLTKIGVPLMVIFGTEDQIYDTDRAIASYQNVPGARTATVQGAGHSPNVEKPVETARLVLGFTNEGGGQPESPPAKPKQKPSKKATKAKSKKSKSGAKAG